MKIAQPGAGRMDSLHGDEDDAPELTADESQAIYERADELMADRMDNLAHFDDLLAGIEPGIINHPLHRALRNLDNACSGGRIGIDAVLTALCQIQRTVAVEAERVWREECCDEAEQELAASYESTP
jgi:hypothetical protein